MVNHDSSHLPDGIPSFPITADALRIFCGDWKVEGVDSRTRKQIGYLARRIFRAYIKASVTGRCPFPVRCYDDGYMDGLTPLTQEWVQRQGYNVWVDEEGRYYLHYADHVPAPHRPDDEWQDHEDLTTSV